MNIKINIVNDKFLNISPLAFGDTFVNLSEFVENETAEKTFENIGVYAGKKIKDYEGNEYKVIKIDEMNEFENRSNERVFKIELRKM